MNPTQRLPDGGQVPESAGVTLDPDWPDSNDAGTEMEIDPETLRTTVVELNSLLGPLTNDQVGSLGTLNGYVKDVSNPMLEGGWGIGTAFGNVATSDTVSHNHRNGLDALIQHSTGFVQALSAALDALNANAANSERAEGATLEAVRSADPDRAPSPGPSTPPPAATNPPPDDSTDAPSVFS